MSLCKLPDELLLIIFNYCDPYDLIPLSGVCKRLYCIASEFLLKESNNLLITGQKSEKFRERCQPLLSSYREKFYIHNNWKRGRYGSKIFYPKHVSSKFQCYNDGKYNRLQMTKDMILLSTKTKIANNLCAFNRTKNGLVSDDNVIVAKCDSVIMDIFVPRNDNIVTLHLDGSIQQWTIESLDERKYFNQKLLRSSCSNALIKYTPIDVTPQSIIIAAYRSKIELWKYIPEENSIMDKYIIPDFNLYPASRLCVHFIKFDPTGTKFAARMSRITEDDERLIIYDINKCSEIHIRAEDLDLKVECCDQIFWKEPNNILYLTSDKVIKFDARTHKLVQKWNNPIEHLIYRSDYTYGRFKCMSTDDQYAIMTGTSYGKVILWDQRKSDFIQVYDNNDVDCVDCLQFDSSHMYVLANYGIYEFDFTKL